ERLLSKVRELPPGLTPPFLRAQVARFEGRLAVRDGNLDRADASFAGAVSGFRAIGARFWMGVTLVEQAEALVAGGRPEDAHAPAQEARPVLEDVGVPPWLERLDGLESISAREPAPAHP